MRIVQTFWTAGRDPLTHGFGWTHPEYNLMSWALSCLSLREHYDEVALYTDAQGKRVLIDLLHLPYTEVHVVYDETLCLPQHWAYAKIRTYSLQTKPFLHVDGDVYLPKPIPEDILNAPLIAQNSEIGAEYYRWMIGTLIDNSDIHLEDYIYQGLREDNIASYNMGVFGGSDFNFIQNYCQEVETFLRSNKILDSKSSQSEIECNVFFEQIIFALYSQKVGRNISCVIDHPVLDQGYTISEFCNIKKFSSQHYFHLLGGHKRNNTIMEMLDIVFSQLYPKLYQEILGLFPKHNLRFQNRKQPSYMDCMSIYNQFKDRVRNELAYLRPKDIHVIATGSYYQDCSEVALNRNRNHVSLKINRFVRMLYIPTDWNRTALSDILQNLGSYSTYPLRMVCVVPVLKEDGIRAVPISPTGEQILTALMSGTSNVGEMEEYYMARGQNINQENIRGMKRLFYSNILALIRSNVIEINQKCM